MFSLLAWGCSFTPSFHYASSSDLEFVSPGVAPASECYLPANYVPDTQRLEYTPMKYVRVNVHFMNAADSSANFSKPEADSVGWWIVHYANLALERNRKMLLPLGNETPVLPVQFRYRITGRPDDPDDNGIYCHYDDSLFYYIHKGPEKNLYDRAVIQTYGRQLDTVLNIFLMPFPPDSLPPGEDSPAPVGVALGKAVKIGGITGTYHPLWDFKSCINHEVGHIYGLRHAWYKNDGCDDTPPNPNCWYYTQNGSDCDSLVSNNLMDYNTWQNAITPCQIGIVQSKMARENARGRSYLIPNWCALDSEKTIRIRDTVIWSGAKDLEGELIVEPGGHLTLRCRVSLPKEARIIVAGGGTLLLDGCRLHNACGDQWDGILLQQTSSGRGRLLVGRQPVLENALHAIDWPQASP